MRRVQHGLSKAPVHEMKMMARTIRTHRSISRRGITLIEVMIAAGMAAIILAGLWSLLTTFSRLYQQGIDESTRLSLVRAIERQLTEDLRGAIELQYSDSEMPWIASSTEQVDQEDPNQTQDGMESFESTDSPLSVDGFGQSENRVGLVGTNLSLELDIWSSVHPAFPPDIRSPLTPVTRQESLIAVDTTRVAPDTQRSSDLETAAGVNSQGLVSRVPELQRVSWRFISPSELMFTTALGLERTVSTWESAHSADNVGFTRSPVDQITERPQSSTMLAGGEPRAFERMAFPVESSDTRLHRATNVHLDRVPEISRFQLRYFDGNTWRDSWNSNMQRQLPVAIEVFFDLDPSHGGEPNTQVRQEVPAGSMDAHDPLRNASARPDRLAHESAHQSTQPGHSNGLGQPTFESQLGLANWKPQHRLVINLRHATFQDPSEDEGQSKPSFQGNSHSAERNRNYNPGRR